MNEVNRFEVISNINETPLYFDVVPGRVLEKKGKKLFGPLDAKRHLTVVLSSWMAWYCQPLLFLKGKNNPNS